MVDTYWTEYVTFVFRVLNLQNVVPDLIYHLKVHINEYNERQEC